MNVGSGDEIRLSNSLCSGLPGESTRNAMSRWSRRNLAFRALSSGPWHLKQCRARIGRTSVVNKSGSAARSGKATKIETTPASKRLMDNSPGQFALSGSLSIRDERGARLHIAAHVYLLLAEVDLPGRADDQGRA